MDFFAAVAVVALALLSYWPPTRHAHLATIFVALAMIVFGRFASGGEIGPGFQNHILVGLLLLMFALVPNDASRPPKAWRGDEPAQGG
jgi:peptidoglycan/LPS O-acetylase OafA/YrhL